MVELAPDWTRWDILTFAKVIPLSSCQGGLSDGQTCSWPSSWVCFNVCWKLFLCKAIREVLVMDELTLGQAHRDASTFVEVVLLLGCQGGFGDGWPCSLVGFMGRIQWWPTSFPNQACKERQVMVVNFAPMPVVVSISDGWTRSCIELVRRCQQWPSSLTCLGG